MSNELNQPMPTAAGAIADSAQEGALRQEEASSARYAAPECDWWQALTQPA